MAKSILKGSLLTPFYGPSTLCFGFIKVKSIRSHCCLLYVMLQGILQWMHLASTGVAFKRRMLEGVLVSHPGTPVLLTASSNWVAAFMHLDFQKLEEKTETSFHEFFFSLPLGGCFPYFSARGLTGLQPGRASVAPFCAPCPWESSSLTPDPEGGTVLKDLKVLPQSNGKAGIYRMPFSVSLSF